MRQLRARLCAAALLLCASAAPLLTTPAHAEPSAAPVAPAAVAPAAVAPAAVARVDGPVEVTRADARTVCPTLAESPLDESAASKTVIDLNTADERALLDLPGIGPARARAILEYRVAHGGFRSVSQLLQIRGIGRALLKQLRPLVTLTNKL